MEFAQQLQNWIDWARLRVDPAQPWKLSIGQKRLPAPWLGDALFELYDDLAADQELSYITEACEEALVASGNDIASRFVSLHLHYWLLRLARVRVEAEPEELADDDDILLQAVIPGFKRLVELLSIDDIPRAWPSVRWEILNSYAAGLWDRALWIFELSERSGLIPAQHLRLMRGHVRYLLAVWDSADDPADDLIWDPRVLGSSEDFYPPSPMSTEDADQVVQAIVFGSAVHVPAFKPIAPEHLDTLRDARNDLEKAMAAGPVAPVYEAMLARACRELGAPAPAAHHYRSLLKRTIDFGSSGSSRDFRPAIWLHVARSHRGAEEAQKAFATLTEALREYPADRDLLLEQADLAAQETDYRRAFESMNAAMDADPQLRENLGFRVGAVLGEAFLSVNDRAAVEKALSAHPEVEDLLTDVIRAYWPAFSRLTEDAQSEWLMGHLQAWASRNSGVRIRTRVVEHVVVAFAKVVEMELRRRLFKPAKGAFAQLAQEKKRATTLTASQPEDRFVLYVQGNEKSLTLGEMQRILEATRKSQVGLSSQFRSWLNKECSRWEDLVPTLPAIVAVRNAVVHGEEGIDVDLKQVREQCRKALDILAAR